MNWLFAISLVWLFMFVSALVVGGLMYIGVMLGWIGFSIVVGITVLTMFYLVYHLDKPIELEPIKYKVDKGEPVELEVVDNKKGK